MDQEGGIMESFLFSCGEILRKRELSDPFSQSASFEDLVRRELFFYMQYYRSHDCWVPSMFGRVTKLFLVGKMLEAGYEALAKNILAPLASTGIFEKVCFSL